MDMSRWVKKVEDLTIPIVDLKNYLLVSLIEVVCISINKRNLKKKNTWALAWFLAL